MIIIGGFEEVSTRENLVLGCDDDANNITPIDVIYEIFDKKMLPKYKKLSKKGVSLALHASDLRELIYICNIEAKYVVANKEDAVSMQKAVDNYMFDTKLLVLIYEEEDIEWAVANEIDGVIFAIEGME